MDDVKNKQIYKIGLTGGLASGKSTAAKIFLRHNIPVVDCDEIVATLWDKNEIKTLIRYTFNIPSDITDDNLKTHVSHLIFNDETFRVKLNNLLHPLVFENIKSKLQTLDSKMVVIDMPLLFELDYKEIDTTLLIYLPEHLQLKRLCLRNKIDGVTAKNMLSSQIPMTKKFYLADHVIDNSDSITALERAIENFIKEIKNEIK